MIPLSKPFFDLEELEAVKSALDSGWVAGQGPKGEELEESVKDFTSKKFAIAVNNCTAGLHLALLAIGVKNGDEVLVSDFTFPATGHSVLYCKAQPRFVDVELATYNINALQIEKMVNKKTKAIIVVHALGQMANMTDIMAIASKYNLKVIEDAACSLGAKHNDRMAGSYGDITVFSFHARKNITSGEGGMIVTDSNIYAKFIKSHSCFGIESAKNRENKFSIPKFNSLGFNYKLSDINAAIINVQLKKYSKIINRKRYLVDIYNSKLKGCEFISIPTELKINFHVYQTYAIFLDKRINRNRVIECLREKNIQSQIGTYASHLLPIYDSNDNCPNSALLFNQSLALPLHHALTKDDINKVVYELNNAIKNQIENF